MDPDSSIVPLGLAATVCVLLAGFFAAGETAFSGINRFRLQARAEEGDAQASALLRTMAHPQRLLTTILVGKNLARAATMILLARLAGPWLNDWLGLVLLILLTTALLFSVSEVLPKALVSTRTETTALLFDRPIRLMAFVLSPAVSFLGWVMSPFMRVLGARFGQLGPHFTEDEIRTMVDIGEETGVFERQETELIHSALAFDEIRVGSVLTPRVDMVCVPVEASLDEALSKMINVGYSRLPVYQDDIDHVVGIVTLKDLLLAKQAKPDSSAPVSFYMRPAYHVPEYKRVDELLHEMQARRMQMAIVSDEYGGTAGLITLEDLLEEIVGEIRDEHDYDEQPPMVTIDEHTVVVDARLGVGEVNEHLRTDLPNSQTVGGLVFNTLGRVPELGETVRIGLVELTVEHLEGIRVQKVRVQKLKPGTAELILIDEDAGAVEGSS